MASEPARKRKRPAGQQPQPEVLRRPAAAATSRLAERVQAALTPPAPAGQAALAAPAPVATPARKSPKTGVAAAKGLAVEAAPSAPSRPAALGAAAGPAAAAAPPSAAAASSSGAPSSASSAAPAAPGAEPRPAPAGLAEAGEQRLVVDDKKNEGLAFLRLSSECAPSLNVERLVYLDKDEVTFGRMPSNSVILDSARVPQMISRVHARLCRLREEGKPVEWLLHDNKSMNGILVNGQTVGKEEGHRLKQGDIINFGRKMSPPEFEFVFDKPGSEPEPAAAAAEPDPAVEEAFAEHARRIAELQQELEAERERKIMESQQRAATRSALDVEDIQSELLCSICQDWVVHASTIECSHTFCWSCIDTWLLQKKFECPVCRHAVTREPVRSRAIEAIVQKTVDRGDGAEKAEYLERTQAAEKDVKKVKKLHADLEKSVNEALKKGKAFFHVDSSWSRREKEVFQRGVKDYTGDTRETYCRLTGLTVQWAHSADEGKLNQALHNLGLQAFVSSSEGDIRKRLLMFLRYG